MKNLFSNQILNFLTIVTLTFAVKPASSQINNIAQDTLSQMICGDLHEFIAKNQAEYAKFLNNQPSEYTPQEDWNPDGVFQCGSFTVYYEDFDAPYQAGFADSQLGEARRNTLCEVLAYVESVLDFHPNANPILVVHYSLVPDDNPAPPTTGYLAKAGPEFDPFIGQGIYDGLMRQYILTGVDPDPAKDVDANLFVNFDKTFDELGNAFEVNYFNIEDDLLDPVNNVSKIDLSTVLLHEITHTLGFISAMVEGPTGQLECFSNISNTFTRFDWEFGYYENIENLDEFADHKLVKGTESVPFINPNINLISYPLRQGNIWISDEGPPNNFNLFASNYPNLKGSFLSHLGVIENSLRKRQQYSPGRYMSYVMDPIIHIQEIKREWTLPELRMLLQMDYELNPIFANQTSLSFPNLNSVVVNNSPPFRSDYADPDRKIVTDGDIVSYADDSPADFTMTNSNTILNQNLAVLTIDITDDNTLEDPDLDPVFTLPEYVFGIRGVGTGNEHQRLTLDPSGTVFTFKPEPGYYGRAEFGFFLWDGKEMGAMEVYTIDVIRDPNIIYGDEQELVINGSFEDGLELKTWESPNKVYTNSYWAPQNPQLNGGNVGSGGGHRYNATDVCYIKHSCDGWPQYPSYDHVFGYSGSNSTASPVFESYTRPYPSSTPENNNRFSTQGGVISTLVAPLTPGEYYELKFDYAAAQIGLYPPSAHFNIGDVLNVNYQIIDEPYSANSFNVIQQIDATITIDQLVTAEAPVQWQSKSIIFQYCGTNPAFFIRSMTTGNLIELFIDNVSLKKTENAPVLSFTAGPDLYITSTCNGSQIQSDITNPGCQMTYSWTPITGLSDPTILNPIASPSQTTTYTLTITDVVSGSSGSDDVTVFVYDPLENYGPVTLCASDEPISIYDYFNIPASEIIVAGPTGDYFTPENGIFDPSAYDAGEYIVVYYVGEGNCQIFDLLYITIQGFSITTASHPNGLIVIDNSTNDGATLSGNFQFLDDLVIEDGAVFTLSNAQMQFAEGKGIHVETGGKLYIKNGSHLTNVDCGTNWAGIYVHGNGSYSQVPSQVYHQGQCYIENSTVENALRGITNYAVAGATSSHGGIFRCLNTTFRNCEISADILSYANQNPANGVHLPINCKFYNSTFIWDEDFQFMNSQANPMIHLYAVDQVTISGCTFTNTNTDIFTYPNNASEKAGIFANKASIVLSKGCTGLPPYAMNIDGSCQTGDVPSKFTGLNYGVELIDGSTSSITQTIFNCYRGLWLIAGNEYKVTQNNFGNLPSNLIQYSGQNNGNDPMWQVPYGAYLDGTDKFWLEGNTFNYPLTTTDVGLFIRGSGPGYNNAYLNTFYKTTYGSVAYDDNRGTTGNNGLKYECNSFTGNILSISAIPTIFNPPTGWGISKVQGVPPLGLYPADPAGNHFIGDNIYNVYNSLEQVIYYTHPSENLQTYLGISPVPTNIENTCLSSFPSPYGKEGLMAEHKAEADSIHTVLSGIIDDGDTQSLTNEVVLADYGEAAELYYDLMQVSPNLSEDVMIEAINKEFELPASLLTLILNSNPHAAKSGRIQKELDERMTPLAEYQRDMINQGLDLVSYKEGLEASESYHRSRYDFLLNQVIFEILTDTTNTDKISAIISAIDGYETVDHYYLIIDMYLKAGKVSEAQSWLNFIATDFNLDPRRDAEYADFIAVYSILFDKATTGDTALSQTEQNTLELIAYKHSTLAAGLARVTLYGYTGIPFLETLVEPEIELTPKSMNNNTKAPEIKTCKVYPNPTAGILLVEIPLAFKEVDITVRDGNGKIVHNEVVGSGMVTLNLRHLSSGSYILHLLATDGTLNEIHQIQVAK